MEERRQFVAGVIEGDKTATLCRECGISRRNSSKTNRHYRNIGLEVPIDRSRRPYRQAGELPSPVSPVKAMAQNFNLTSLIGGTTAANEFASPR